MKMCLVLIDVWALPNYVNDNKIVRDANLHTRRNIAMLMQLAKLYSMDIVINNTCNSTLDVSFPFPLHPLTLQEHILGSGMVLDSNVAFVEDGLGEGIEIPSNVILSPKLESDNYDVLVYAGYAADYCVALKRNDGYLNVVHDRKYIVANATLVRCGLGESGIALTDVWPEWCKVARARPLSEGYPWKSVVDYMGETYKFCYEYAADYVKPIMLLELADFCRKNM